MMTNARRCYFIDETMTVADSHGDNHYQPAIVVEGEPG